MIRIPIRLTDESLTALRTLAKQEYRDVRQQAAWIIEHELERQGLLIIETQTNSVSASVDALVRAHEIKQEGENVTG